MMKLSDKITIVVPCKNEENYIAHLLMHLRQQSIGDTRIIIADCSTDNTREVIQATKGNLNVEIIHIVDSVADALRNVNIIDSKIGVIGTQATIELGLYQYRLNKLGWNCIVPSKEEMNTLVQPAIDLIKANQIESAHPMLIKIICSLIDKGAKAVVLGCTEIPLSVREDTVHDTLIINSSDSLVKSAIKKFKRN